MEGVIKPADVIDLGDRGIINIRQVGPGHAQFTISERTLLGNFIPRAQLTVGPEGNVGLLKALARILGVPIVPKIDPKVKA